MSLQINLQNRYPNSWFSFPYLNHTFQVLDPGKLLTDFILYRKKLNEWDIKTIYLVGLQGSGKTNFIRFFIWLICHIYRYVFRGVVIVFTNDIRILGDKRYSYLFEGNKIIILICDDAIGEGYDSRTSMHGVTKDITQKFVQSRHRAKDSTNDETGILFTIFATQDYERLDKTLRKNALLKIFTSYVDDESFDRLFPPSESELLRVMSYDGHIASDFNARRFALARTFTKDIATLSIPFVSWDVLEQIVAEPPNAIKKKMIELKETRAYQVNYHIIDLSIDKNEIITELAKEILDNAEISEMIKYIPTIKSLEDFNRGELRGFLGTLSTKYKKERNINLTKSDYISAIDRALWIRKQYLLNEWKSGEFESNEIEESEDDSNLTQISSVFKSNLNEKILHISDIIERTGLIRGQIAGILSAYGNFFINVIPYHGFWSYIKNMPTEQEISDFIESNQINVKKELKKLVMTE